MATIHETENCEVCNTLMEPDSDYPYCRRCIDEDRKCFFYLVVAHDPYQISSHYCERWKDIKTIIDNFEIENPLVIKCKSTTTSVVLAINSEYKEMNITNKDKDNHQSFIEGEKNIITLIYRNLIGNTAEVVSAPIR